MGSSIMEVLRPWSMMSLPGTRACSGWSPHGTNGTGGQRRYGCGHKWTDRLLLSPIGTLATRKDRAWIAHSLDAALGPCLGQGIRVSRYCDLRCVRVDLALRNRPLKPKKNFA